MDDWAGGELTDSELLASAIAEHPGAGRYHWRAGARLPSTLAG